MTKRKTILITGINGFLGSNLANKLHEEYNILGLEYNLDNLNRLVDTDFLIYSSKGELIEIFEKHSIFAIIHAATVYRRINDPIVNLISTNVLLPVRLYELATKFKVNLFINTDTFFNNSKYNYSFLPDYTLSKKHLIDWLKLLPSNNKIVNMKIHHMYGPNDASSKFVPSIIALIKRNDPFLNATLGEQRRDFIFIDDVVDSFKKVLSSESKLEIGFNEFEVGNGISFSIKSFIKKVKKISGSKTELRFGSLPYRENEIMEAHANNFSLLELGWRPSNTLEMGIEKILKNI